MRKPFNMPDIPWRIDETPCLPIGQVRFFRRFHQRELYGNTNK